MPPAKTTTGCEPVATPKGTVAKRVVPDQPDTIATMPPMVTEPGVAPKARPEIMTDAPRKPEVGDNDVILGEVVVVTAKSTELLEAVPVETKMAYVPGETAGTVN